jgi:hypothetical protein
MPLSQDPDAIHQSTAGEIALLVEKVTPVSADLIVIEDSASGNIKKKIQLGNFSSASGRDYQNASSEGVSTTTSAVMQDKVALTTGDWTGVYRVNYYCELTVNSANKYHEARLYNATDAAELCYDDLRPSLPNQYHAASGFYDITMSGAAKTFKVQFASPDGSTVSIRRARIEIWKETAPALSAVTLPMVFAVASLRI